jgi:hypothetical protein
MSRRSIAEMRGVDERVREMTEQGRSSATIALELGVNERTVNRYRSRLGIANPAARVPTAEEARWIETVRSEGMPSTWVAETVKVSADAVRRRAGMPAGAQREWLIVWSAIRQNPVLLALHREFVSPGADMEAAA